MKKIMSLKKQVEERARKWLIQNNKGIEQKQINEYFKNNKKEIIEQYLIEHPKIAKQYQEKKRVLNRVGIALATGGLIATTLAGAYYVTRNDEPDKNQGEKIVEVETIDENEQEENKLDAFFEEAKNMKNTNNRDEFITEQTKQIIVEAYNKENPENPITVDRLETLILNEWVLQKTDRLGNSTYERVPQNVIIEQTEEQKLVKIGNIYDFRIDGETVAVFDSNGDVLMDKNVEQQDMSFQKTVELVKQSENLKDIYKYKNNDYQIEKQEQNYEATANKLLEEKDIINIKSEIQK